MVDAFCPAKCERKFGRIIDVRNLGIIVALTIQERGKSSYTKLDNCVWESVSHQRLIRYEIGGIECIVRCEGDGYLKDKAKESSPGSYHLAKTEGLRMLAGGMVISQEAMFDIKTLSIRRKGGDILGGEIDRLWLRQIPNFIVAHHRSGTFDDIQIVDVGNKIAQWETEHADDLRTFSAIIEKIITYARSQAGTVFEVCSQRRQILEFRRLGEQSNPVLPDELRQVWSQSGLTTSESSEKEDSDGYVGSDAEGGVDLNSIGAGDSDAEPDYTASFL
ncbi:hypothetical protein B0A48_18344 [Cryoendolithus antarcticus]|uniref:Uncharacterized protein n=1 Tax=Cryoendolithus antarcticus TaxID=1507870 RepID=A0A1V8SA56_9PEZI|nr:hypothetical protein B0A48_18344 [Cryoendolithus antarcticus]